MKHPAITCLDELEALFAGAGGQLYGGEAISQLEHALQAALAAESEGATPELIVAALLHDVGHLITGQGDDDVENGSNDHHEAIGAVALAALFSEDVCQPIALHVAAKRFLCATEPGYIKRLSPASLASLKLQGGIMDSLEAARFAARRHAADAVRLRRWDEVAKVPGLATPPLAHYLGIAQRVMVRGSLHAAF
ncbi:phosphonate degradation HD-domain oxygenase [Chitinilyticum litopenaei]|uniref:phosphonate degradation HD-domain oxygenase n=1 Tax=Chitinilyticum litopenaei TaxID=1121276 RepID=UPI0003FF85E1|nr:phosphonate degradation HD-domain oxygenase [Chitinilyticum litopenaei]